MKKRYADGGKAATPKENVETSKPDPKLLGTGTAARAGNVLRNRRKEQMEALGLKDGGLIRVGKPKANKVHKGSFGHNY